MFIEQPPLFYRIFYPGAVWRIKNGNEKMVYLTFDDGPIPEVTPWVLEVLDTYRVKATFFCVGDNVRKHPSVYRQILEKGHQTGNHTFNHIQGWKHNTNDFIANTQKANSYIQSPFFRPPHGHILFPQFVLLKKKGYKLIMWDVVTRDYSNHMTPEKVLDNVKKYVRNGSIIVFHDSLKAEKNVRYALPLAIEWLKREGYSFGLIH
ncbi:polysaccharide deacetylase family protein [Anaerorudis cellulosivorans]|uniref:polysaccharide deacetylase family protein n=1 Tax=Anaerorudis cellulosivorans TaxID=3397862 RepID=UPI00221FD678|nr:polysaccharide deacetylase family protein [Seramator thermalis]MCW1734320.1 polysaccharide deacetylase family protein [Seramator thermalis]